MFPRCLPPSAAPLTFGDILAALTAIRGDHWSSSDLFTSHIRDRFAVKHCFLYSTGRGALSVLLQTLKSKNPEKEEVVIPAYTSFSVPSAVVNAGLKVSPCDLDPDSLSLDIESLRRAINRNTLCVVGCHLFGYLYDIAAVKKELIAREIPLVDDAAQAMGGYGGGRWAGGHGVAGIYSLSRGKNITAVDGGIIVTDDDALAASIEKIPTLAAAKSSQMKMIIQAFVLAAALNPRLYWFPQSLPFLRIGASVYDPGFSCVRMGNFQALLGSRVLKHLDKINSIRRGNAGLLMEALHGQEVKVPQPVQNTKPVFLRLPVMASGASPRPELGIVRSYPTTVNAIPGLQKHLASSDRCPGAEMLAGGIITLPTHHHVTGADMAAITDHLTQKKFKLHLNSLGRQA